jgi:hypothetical protein
MLKQQEHFTRSEVKHGMTISELLVKIQQLTIERDNFASNANKMIGQYNGKLEAYQEWLQELNALHPPEEPHTDPLYQEHKDDVG